MKVGRLIVLGALALAATGCGGTGGAGAGASDVIPANVPVYVAIDTDPGSGQWKTVDRLAGHFPDKQKGVDGIKRAMRKDGIDWEKDLKPALGKELDFAWLDLENGGQDFVALVQPSDEGAFKRFIEKADANENPSDRVVYEKVGDWEVLAKNRATIDRFKRESSAATRTLSDEGSFNHAMNALGGDNIVRAYANGAKLMDLVRANTPPDAQKFINKVGTLDWIALDLGVKPDGLASDAIVHGTPGTLFKGAPHANAFAPNLTKSLPQSALVYFTFHGSRNMLAGLQKNPLLARPGLRAFSGVLKQIGSLLQGENALYVREPASGVIPEVTFVADPGHGVEGAAVLDRLLKRFQAQTGVVPKRTAIDGTASRTLRFGSFAVHYANVNGKLVVTDLPQGIHGVKSPGTPLAKSSTFQDVQQTSGMPMKTQAFFYVNIHSTIPAVERMTQTHLTDQISRNLKPLRSAVEYAVSRSHEFEISFFLRIK